MQIQPHVEELQRQLVNAAAPGGEAAEELAGRLITALEPSARLAILEALSEAAGEITRELAPGSVDVRLRGREIDFVVSRPAAEPAVVGDHASSGPVPTAADDADDAATSRTTLRLPDAVKARAEQAAAAEGVSLNTWLVRAITAALEPARRAVPTVQGSSFAGWVR